VSALATPDLDPGRSRQCPCEVAEVAQGTEVKRTATRWDFVALLGGRQFGANPSLSVSTGTTRGGLSVSILQRRRMVSNEFPYEVRVWTPIDLVSQVAHLLEQWPRGESNSHVLPDTGS
jgi:hypothetical protein